MCVPKFNQTGICIYLCVFFLPVFFFPLVCVVFFSVQMSEAIESWFCTAYPKGVLDCKCLMQWTWVGFVCVCVQHVPRDALDRSVWCDACARTERTAIQLMANVPAKRDGPASFATEVRTFSCRPVLASRVNLLIHLLANPRLKLWGQFTSCTNGWEGTFVCGHFSTHTKTPHTSCIDR